jgi:hypothetical protein
VGKLKTQCFTGRFVRFVRKDESPPPVSGFFSSGGDRSFTFNFNPGETLERPVKASIFKDLFPAVFSKNVRLNTECEVVFHVDPSSLKSSRNPSPFPSEIKNFAQSPALAKVPVTEPTDGSFPREVFEGLRSLADFQIHIVVGLPENDVIPSLSLSDFLFLQDANAVNMAAIEAKVGEKYVRIEKEGGGGRERLSPQTF